jgi:hypothetical protein
MGIFFRQICRGNQKTRLKFSNFVLENGAVYEIIWKNIIEPDGTLMSIYDACQESEGTSRVGR